jgi:hypothetical protein
MEVVGAYHRVLAEYPRLLRPVSILPYPKTKIEEALQIATRSARDPEVLRWLDVALQALQDFIPDEDVPADRIENMRHGLSIEPVCETTDKRRHRRRSDGAGFQS